MSPPRDLYAVPIDERPPMALSRYPAALGFFVVFGLGHVITHAMQLVAVFCVALPLHVLCAPFGLRFASHVHDEIVRWSKGCYSALLLLTTQWFSPTEITVSMEGDNLKPEEVLVYNKKGRLVALNLPTNRVVVMANHQIYSDWIFVWHLLYFCNLHMDVYIVLKKSLKWVPVVGWGMQVFRFLFLARSWAHDKEYLARKLADIGKLAEQKDQPLALVLYPEGTLVSKDTRPISKKYADKMGISDGRYTLLPRSTGMQYALRSLSPRVPDLHVLDITVAYPGIPRMGYGQSYYTLRSVGFGGIPPPRIHMHLKLYHVRRDVPIGQISTSGISKEVDGSEEDRVRFEEWIRERFVKKDDEFDRYYATGSLAGTDSQVIPEAESKALRTNGSADGDAKVHTQREVSLPLRLRSRWEWLDALAVPFGPTAWGLLTGKLR
ncbi:acyltransferase-domain-containing protein [Auricularia subglabra TFB-10046 SS5]|nr:acyltransferase-domain-containing protein [Auricularia subglabra TFB-10046 SS5]